MLSQTNTPTTAGFESFFQMDSFLGLPVTPTQFLTISLISSLLSTIFKSIKMIKLEKGFFRFKPKLMVGIWSGFAAIRKISSIVAFFTPSLGLFSILHHWQYENIPFKVRLEQAITHGDQVYLQNVKIALYNTTKEIAWSSLDHWSYDEPLHPRPPPSSMYTFLSPQSTFLAYVFLCFMQIMMLLIVKLRTSDEFKDKNNFFKKMIHLIQVCNMPMPYKDWDSGNFSSIEAFKEKYKKTKREMCLSFGVSFVFTLISIISYHFL